MSSLSKRASSQLKITVDIDDLKHFKKEHGTVDAFLKSHRLSGLSTNTKKVRDACEISISAQSNSDVYRAASLFQRYLSEWWDIIKSGDINQAKQQIKQDKKVIHRVTSHGATCLMVACGHRGYSLGHTDPDLVAPNGRMLDFLLDQGAKAHLPDSKGRKCADLVTDRPALAAMLTHGATSSASGTETASSKKRKSLKQSSRKSPFSRTVRKKKREARKDDQIRSKSTRASHESRKAEASKPKRKSSEDDFEVGELVRKTSGLSKCDAHRIRGIDLASLFTSDAADLGLPALQSIAISNDEDTKNEHDLG